MKSERNLCCIARILREWPSRELTGATVRRMRKVEVVNLTSYIKNVLN